jgi:hypothetical protein
MTHGNRWGKFSNPLTDTGDEKDAVTKAPSTVHDRLFAKTAAKVTLAQIPHGIREGGGARRVIDAVLSAVVS